MSSHARYECKHGTVIIRCRCPSIDKHIIVRPCPEYCPVGRTAKTLREAQAQ